jgi:hypothetical protein
MVISGPPARKACTAKYNATAAAASGTSQIGEIGARFFTRAVGACSRDLPSSRCALGFELGSFMLFTP